MAMTTTEAKTFVKAYENLKEVCFMMDLAAMGKDYHYNFTSRLAALKENNDSAYSALVKFYATYPIHYWKNNSFESFCSAVWMLDGYFKLFENGNFEVFGSWDRATSEYVANSIPTNNDFAMLYDIIDYDKLRQKMERLPGNNITSYSYHTLFDETVLHLKDN